MRPPNIAAVGVVIPAHNEENSLAACLQSIHEAADRISVPTVVVVVADGCTDTSAAVAARWPHVHLVHTLGGNVGGARRVGMAAATRTWPIGADRLWLATTDADSAVLPDWLAHQVDAADAGVDATVGTVALADDGIGRPARLRFDLSYTSWKDGSRGPAASVHPHVHGANLGVRSSAYLGVGGFPAARAHEDRQLVHRLDRAVDLAVLRSEDLPVRTSGRMVGRAPAGVAHDLRRDGSR